MTADLLSFPAPEISPQADKLLRWSREIALELRPDMVGFVVVAWGRDGGTTVAADPLAKENPIPRALLPAWVGGVMRRDLDTMDEAKRLLSK